MGNAVPYGSTKVEPETAATDGRRSRQGHRRTSTEASSVTRRRPSLRGYVMERRERTFPHSDQRHEEQHPTPPRRRRRRQRRPRPVANGHTEGRTEHLESLADIERVGVSDFPTLCTDELQQDATGSDSSTFSGADLEGACDWKPRLPRKSLSAPTVPCRESAGNESLIVSDVDFANQLVNESPRSSWRLSAPQSLRRDERLRLDINSGASSKGPLKRNGSGRTNDNIDGKTSLAGQRWSSGAAEQSQAAVRMRRAKSMKVSGLKSQTRNATDAFENYIKMIASKRAVPSLLDLHSQTNRLHASNFDSKAARMSARKQRRGAAVDFTMRYAESAREVGDYASTLGERRGSIQKENLLGIETANLTMRLKRLKRMLRNRFLTPAQYSVKRQKLLEMHSERRARIHESSTGLKQLAINYELVKLQMHQQHGSPSTLKRPVSLPSSSTLRAMSESSSCGVAGTNPNNRRTSKERRETSSKRTRRSIRSQCPDPFKARQKTITSSFGAHGHQNGERPRRRIRSVPSRRNGFLQMKSVASEDDQDRASCSEDFPPTEEELAQIEKRLVESGIVAPEEGDLNVRHGNRNTTRQRDEGLGGASAMQIKAADDACLDPTDMQGLQAALAHFGAQPNLQSRHTVGTSGGTDLHLGGMPLNLGEDAVSSKVGIYNKVLGKHLLQHYQHQVPMSSGLLRKLRSDSPRRFSDTEVLRRLHARSRPTFQVPFGPKHEDNKTPNAATDSRSNGGGHADRRPSGQGQNRDSRANESGLPFPAASPDTNLSMPSMDRFMSAPQFRRRGSNTNSGF
eukprot:INCI15563.1.p1 GENE.INCI15563.1~~INCI15563.1.p1  ORF type:complete len:799 (-),score=102.04 INCI15563.1:88-2484(-)